MICEPDNIKRALVAIASYGTAHDAYLQQLIREYRSMSFPVDIVVFSNVPRQTSPDVEVIVGLPTKDPWSLPFGHKRLFAERIENYDLFIYSEDDTLIAERNIRAFLKVSTVLPENVTPGFFRFERGPNGTVNYPDVHAYYHWDPASVWRRGEYTFAFFTNEHSASYILTRQQLRQAIASGGFLVRPYEGKYDLACSAATDPYTQCGFRKLICLSHLDDFLVHHLPNKYVGVEGVEEPELRGQIEALLRGTGNGHPPASLYRTETKLKGASYSKNYYEPARGDVISAIPAGTRSVLSIGCAWGATEMEVASKGVRVVAVPVDPVVSDHAKNNGVEMVYGDFQKARSELGRQSFDCLLFLNVLHLLDQPEQVLSMFADLATKDSTLIAVVPNRAQCPRIGKKAIRDGIRKAFGSYEVAGVQWTSRGVLQKWFRSAGMRIDQIVDVVPPRAQVAGRVAGSLLAPWLASEFVVVAHKN